MTTASAAGAPRAARQRISEEEQRGQILRTPIRVVALQQAVVETIRIQRPDEFRAMGRITIRLDD
jgi:hypothetical protein